MTDNTDNTDQTVLQTVTSHTVRVVFDDTFNDHTTNHGSNRDKTVYTVDSYDNNAIHTLFNHRFSNYYV